VLARIALPLIGTMAAGEIPRVDATALSLPATAFGAGATLLCALLFALPAILYARRLNLLQVIKQSSGEMLSRRRVWFGASLIAMEVALSFAVLAGAGLLYRSFANLLREETGIDASGVLAVEMPLALDWEQSAKKFEQHVSPALRAIPGVRMVAAANCGPMMLHSTETKPLRRPIFHRRKEFRCGQLSSGAIALDHAGIFFHATRSIDERPVPYSSRYRQAGVIVNQTLARKYFPDQSPLGSSF